MLCGLLEELSKVEHGWLHEPWVEDRTQEPLDFSDYLLRGEYPEYAEPNKVLKHLLLLILLLPLEPHTAIPDLLIVADPHYDRLRDLIPVIDILLLVATSPMSFISDLTVLILVKLPQLLIVEDLLSLIFLRVRNLCNLRQVKLRRCI